MNAVFLTLAFLSEVAAWTGIGVAAYSALGGGVEGWIGALLAAAASITAWGLWAAPRASAPPALSLTVKVLVFGGAVAGLLLTGHRVTGTVLAALILIAQLGVAVTST